MSLRKFECRNRVGLRIIPAQLEVPKDCYLLSTQEENHLKKQLFYFVPFIRQVYELMRQENQSTVINPVNTGVIKRIKDLAIYYGSTQIFGNFKLEKEQKLIEDIFTNTEIDVGEFKKRVLSVRSNQNGKNDGCLDEYFFGDIKPTELFSTKAAEGRLYSSGLSEGIGIFGQADRLDLINQLTVHIKENYAGLPVAVLGNVARGVLDASSIYAGLQKESIPSSFHLYRASTHAMSDTTYTVLYEQINPESWGIAVDSFTAKGKSVPFAINLMDTLGFQKKSIFLSHMGRDWANELGVEFQWNSVFGEDNWAGTLLGGSINK